jgi:hypothetical protein
MLTTLTLLTTKSSNICIINGLQCSRYFDFFVTNLLPTTKNRICSKVVGVEGYYCCKLKNNLFLFLNVK